MFYNQNLRTMKSIFKIQKAIYLAVCMTFALTLFSGCEEADKRDDYVGSYRVHEVIVGQLLDDYNFNIVKSSANKNDIIINNFFNVSSVALIAVVNGDSFTIPQQTFQTVGFSGSGRRNGNTLNFSTLVTITGSGSVNLETTAVKQ